MIFTDESTFTATVNIRKRGMTLAEFLTMAGESNDYASVPDKSDDYAQTSVDYEHQQPVALAGKSIPLRVYIAGPMSGVPGHNFPAFWEAAKRLRSKGYEVVSPAETDDGDTSHPWEHYLRRDLFLLLDCEAVALLPGWLESKGATLEQHVAHTLGMTCRPLEDWL